MHCLCDLAMLHYAFHCLQFAILCHLYESLLLLFLFCRIALLSAL